MTEKTFALEEAPNKNEVVERIRGLSDEEEVRQITEKYSKHDAYDGEAREEIRIAGIVRWGELGGLEGHVIGCEVRNNYAVNELISEMSMMPVDGIYRTRNVKTGCYAGKVETKGLAHGYRSAFKVVFEMGKQLYGDKFTPEIAKEAFVSACPFKGVERYVSAVPTWFEELNGGEEK